MLPDLGTSTWILCWLINRNTIGSIYRYSYESFNCFTANCYPKWLSSGQSSRYFFAGPPLKLIVLFLTCFSNVCSWIQYLDFEQKWLGAPHAAMLRRHRLVDNDPNDGFLRVVFVLLSTSSDVIQVKYLSVALQVRGVQFRYYFSSFSFWLCWLCSCNLKMSLYFNVYDLAETRTMFCIGYTQPVDLSLHEETLVRLVPFWRTSLSSNAKSRQFYFEHFEIQPIKVCTILLPFVVSW